MTTIQRQLVRRRSDVLVVGFIVASGAVLFACEGTKGVDAGNDVILLDDRIIDGGADVSSGLDDAPLDIPTDIGGGVMDVGVDAVGGHKDGSPDGTSSVDTASSDMLDERESSVPDIVQDDVACTHGDGAIADLLHDPENCGACGNTCTIPMNMCLNGCCMAADCGHNTGLFQCCQSNHVAACVNFMTNNSHCGLCGNACLEGSVCAHGTCVPTL